MFSVNEKSIILYYSCGVSSKNEKELLIIEESKSLIYRII